MAVDLGDVYRLTYRNTAPDGTLANAASVSGTITLPDGTSSVFGPITPTTLGIYTYDYTPTQVGRHVARWAATGTNAGATSEAFDVRPGDPGYLFSLADAKRALNMDLTDTTNDEELRSLVEAVTNAVESYVGQIVVRRTITEQFSVGPRWRYPQAMETRLTAAYKLVLRRTPVVAMTSIVRPIDGVTWTASDVALTDPAAGVVISLRDPFWGDLTATYIAGYPLIPANMIEGAKIILRHLWQTQQAPGMGSSMFGGDQQPVGMSYAIPNRAAELLGGQGPTIA